MIKEKPGRSFYGIYLIFALFIAASLLLFLQSRAFLEEESEPVLRLRRIEAPEGPDNLHFRLIESETVNTYHFTAQVNRDELPPSSSGHTLLAYRIAAFHISFNLNGETIAVLGRSGEKQTNLWNMASFHRIPPRLLQDKNKLEIIIEAEHQLGGIPYPLFIIETRRAAAMSEWFDFLLVKLTLIVQGILIFSFVLFLLLFFSSGTYRKEEYLFFAGAAFCMAVNLTDYLPSVMLPMPFFSFKVMNLAMLYLTFVFINFGLAKIFNSRFCRYLAVVMSIALLIILLFFTKSLISFKEGYARFNLLIPFSIVSWMVLTIRRFREDPRARLLFTATIIMLLFALIEIVAQLTANINYYSFSVFGAMFFCIGLSFLVVLDYLEVRIQLESECARAEGHYHSSITDGLTGVFNKRYILTFLTKLKPPYSLMMIDLDHFKEINDTYGHAAGDRIIQFFADTATSLVRRMDSIARFGGDEFLIILPECDIEQAVLIAQRLQSEISRFSDSAFEEGFGFTISVGVYSALIPSETAEEALEKADKALYRSKEAGRDRVSVFEEDRAK